MAVPLRHVTRFIVPDAAFHADTVSLDRAAMLAALDQARGVHHLVISDAQGLRGTAIATAELRQRCATLIADLPSGQAPPQRLATMAAMARHAEPLSLDVRPLHFVTIPPAATAQPDRWTMPHPYSMDPALFWPGQCAATLADTSTLLSIVDACQRWRHGQPPPPLAAMFPTAHAAHQALTAAPWLPFLMCALASRRVRIAWLRSPMSVGCAEAWALLGHQLLLRAVDYYWHSDAEAAHALAGVPGVRCRRLPAQRVQLLGRRAADPTPPSKTVSVADTFDGRLVDRLSSATGVGDINPLQVSRSFPSVVRLTTETPWAEMVSADAAAIGAASQTGLLGQVVHCRVTARWYLVAECMLDTFIAANSGGSLCVPVEPRRVSRRLVVVAPNDPVPAGAQRLHRGVVDLTPGEWAESPSHLKEPFWPLHASHLLLHPLRSAPESRRVRAGAHWWDCSRPGPSLCLDPMPRADDLAAVLAFQLHHAPNALAPTATFQVSPPTAAAMPAPVPGWWRCRLGCSRCALSQPVAQTGDSALVCRHELACVLWWHWQRFAEWQLCDSPRAADLGEHWFRLELFALSDALVEARRAATPPLSAWRNGSAHQFEDASQCDINRTVEAVASDSGVSPLLVQCIYLVWLINDTAARRYDQWQRVGSLLHQLDSGDEHRLVWHWWSRKYGGDKYCARDFAPGPYGKWSVVAPRHAGERGTTSDCVPFLAGMAKTAQGGQLRYVDAEVRQALDDFQQERARLDFISE